jgi:hypothetical protein
LTFTKDIDLSAEAAARHDERHRARHKALQALFWSALPLPTAAPGEGAAAEWEADERTPTEMMCWGVWPRYELSGYLGAHHMRLGVAWESGRPDGARRVSGLLVWGSLDVVGSNPLMRRRFTEKRDLDNAGAWALDATHWADDPPLPAPGEMQAPRLPRELLPCGRFMRFDREGINRPSSRQARENIGFYLALTAAIAVDTRAILHEVGVLTSPGARLTLIKKAPPAPKAKKA